jgi:uncharacterized protein (DUF885 family)
MRIAILSFVLVFCFAGCQRESAAPVAAKAQDTGGSTDSQSESERLNVWFENKYEQQLLMSPSQLTRLGRRERYDEYDDLSEAEADRRLAWLGATVAELKSQFDYARLDLETQTSYDLWVYRYEQALAGREFRRRNYVITQMQGAHTAIPNFLIRYHQVNTEADMRAYIDRIGAISLAVAQLLERAKLHAAEGVRPPGFAYEAVIEESGKLLAGAPFSESSEAAPIWADALQKIAQLRSGGHIDEATAQSLIDATRQVLIGEFLPSYTALIDWFSLDIDNADREPQGVSELPQGDAFYAYRLKAMTTTDLSADAIHEIGLSEVARLREEMAAVIERVGFTGSLQEFFEYLSTDDRFFYPNTNEGRQAYVDDSQAYLDAINIRLPEFFGLLPKAQLVVKRVEAYREQDGAAQHYMRGTPDGSLPGVYYAHLSDMRSMPKPPMEAVAYHEGNPGHHMQLSIAAELTSVPKFRTRSSYTVYSEGWGLYAELLAKEMGGYQDEYSEFGRLTTEMWRAVRLVVDTGLHAKGWPEAGAVGYFMDNTAIAEGAIRSEVKRYLVMPGQATAYKIGMLKILELRTRAKSALGERFDIREFHDVVLGGGGLPLTILERRIDNWLKSKTLPAAANQDPQASGSQG